MICPKYYFRSLFCNIFKSFQHSWFSLKQSQQQQHQQPFFQLVNGIPPKSPVMASTGGSVKGNIGAGGVVASQAPSIVSQSQIVTSQAPTAPMVGGQMQIISPLQVMSLIRK